MNGLTQFPHLLPRIHTRSLWKDDLGGSRRGVTCEAQRTGVGGGGRSLRIEQVVLQREPAAFAAAMGCRRRPPPPPPPLRVPSALRYSRRVAATVAGGAGGGVARTGLRAPRCLARDLRAWRGGQPGPTALARAARGAKARRAPSWAAWPTPASPRRRLSATAPGLERRRSGSGRAAGLREKDAEPRGEALGPT